MPTLRSRGRGRALLVATFAVVLACADDDVPTEPLPSGCATDVTVSVSEGTTPVFSWTPACRVRALLVERVSDGADLWSIEPAGSQGIASGVQYGVLPANAVQSSPAVPLTEAVNYRVLVAREVRGDRFLAGSASFTP